MQGVFTTNSAEQSLPSPKRFKGYQDPSTIKENKSSSFNAQQASSLPLNRFTSYKNGGVILPTSNTEQLVPPASQFKRLKQLYRSSELTEEQRHQLAYRLFVIYLTNVNSKNGDSSGLLAEQDYVTQTEGRCIMDRLLRRVEDEVSLSHAQNIMDFLLLPNLSTVFSFGQLIVWRAQLLTRLIVCYTARNQKLDRRNVSHALRELCREGIKQRSIECNIGFVERLTELQFQQEKRLMYRRAQRGRWFDAIEHCNNMIRLLERPLDIPSPRFQKQLANAYLCNAQVHEMLHYDTFARKYGKAALSIAQRLGLQKLQLEIRVLLQRIQGRLV